MLSWLKSKFSARSPRTRLAVPLRVRGRYDAAQTTTENARHWANADGLSANAAASPEVRRTLRNRCRYEVSNNSFARGMISTLANDCIGTGPGLQMLTGDEEADRRIENEFVRWAKAVRLDEKLRIMRQARAEDGEAFAVLTTNPKLKTAVKLDVKLVEADQVSTPTPFLQANSVDGIVFDEFGNPLEYHILRSHPGDKGSLLPLVFDRIPADIVIHYFRAERPGQARGVPEITSSLPLFAYLRRYVLAVILGAETAANFAAILKTSAPPGGEAAEIPTDLTIDVERNTLAAVPEGWDISQIRAEQPTTTFAEFYDKMVNWIARCLSMPFNIAACDSSKYNYASGRLDHQTYDLSIRVERSVVESVILDRVLDAWLAEAVLIDGLLPQSSRKTTSTFNHKWNWDGREHVDPSKEAAAQAQRLANFTTTLAAEYGRQGKDWQVEQRQSFIEMRQRLELMQSVLGLTREEALAVVFPNAVPPQPTPEADNEAA